MKVSVIIVNWNSREYVANCLESLRASKSRATLQIIVVDAASFDGVAELLTAQFPEILFIQSTHNLGFGRSNNLAIPHINGDLVLLLNPDTVVSPEALDHLIHAFESSDLAGIIAPKLLNSDCTLQSSCVRALPTPLNRAFDSDWLRRLLPNLALFGTAQAFSSSRIVEVEAVSGACMLMPKDLFIELQGFHPLYFMYGEDMDLCARTRKLGYKILHCPQATVIHHGGGSTGRQPKKTSVQMMRTSWYLYFALNSSASTATIYRTLQLLSAIIRIPFLLIGSCFQRSKRSALLKWLWVLQWSLTYRYKPCRVKDDLLRHLPFEAQSTAKQTPPR